MSDRWEVSYDEEQVAEMVAEARAAALAEVRERVSKLPVLLNENAWVPQDAVLAIIEEVEREG